MLKTDENIYIFVHDLGQLGNVNVTKAGKYSGNIAFNNVKDEIDSIEWLDNGEKLDFVQHNGSLTVNASGYPYGMSTCVRVAKAKLKK